MTAKWAGEPILAYVYPKVGKMSAKVLIVEDDPGHLNMLDTLVHGWGYATELAEDGSIAIQKIKQKPFDVVLMDMRMAEIDGLEALQEIKQYNPAIPILIITAYSSVENAVEALKSGAYDYLTKPLDFEELKIIMERALHHTRLETENRELKQRLSNQDFDLANIVGKSEAMQKLMEKVAMVAPTEASVLITGDSGTGKEIIAQAIHYNSERKKGPMVTVNCAALNESLLESELFGHEKGAFTGADRKRDGKFMQASRGSILLDEITEIPINMQAKLLRVIQEREIQRVGSDKNIQVDVRILASTNKDLYREVENGNFREDLYHRLNVINLEVPPLSEREGDIPVLAQHFLDAYVQQNRKNIYGFTPQAMDYLLNYQWPGNVRELENTVERAVILAQGEYITEKELPPNILPREELSSPAGTDSHDREKNQKLEEVEKQAIINTLQETGGNKSEAARVLGITRATLHKKLNRYNIESN